MNMKQKLTYMLIGCLFTMAGFILSSLFNTPPYVQAQDEKKSVFDKIVCKELEIVSGDGITTAELSMSNSSIDFILAGKRITSVGLTGLEIFNGSGKKLVDIDTLFGKFGTMSTYNADGKELVGIASLDGGKSGYLSIKNADGKELVGIASLDGGKSGYLSIKNADEKTLAYIGSLDDGTSGGMVTFNADGKKLA